MADIFDEIFDGPKDVATSVAEPPPPPEVQPQQDIFDEVFDGLSTPALQPIPPSFLEVTPKISVAEIDLAKGPSAIGPQIGDQFVSPERQDKESILHNITLLGRRIRAGKFNLRQEDNIVFESMSQKAQTLLAEQMVDTTLSQTNFDLGAALRFSGIPIDSVMARRMEEVRLRRGTSGRVDAIAKAARDWELKDDVKSLSADEQALKVNEELDPLDVGPSLLPSVVTQEIFKKAASNVRELKPLWDLAVRVAETDIIPAEDRTTINALSDNDFNNLLAFQYDAERDAHPELPGFFAALDNTLDRSLGRVVSSMIGLGNKLGQLAGFDVSGIVKRKTRNDALSAVQARGDPAVIGNDFIDQGLAAADMIMPIVMSYVIGKGTGTGFGTGATAVFYPMGVEDMDRAMLDAGVAPNISTPVSLLAGIPYMMIERAQTRQLFPPGMNTAALRGIISASLGKTLLTFGRSQVLNLSREVMEEMYQQGLQTMAVTIGAAIDPKVDVQDVVDFADELDTMLETGFESAKTLPFLLVPGAAVQLRTDLRNSQGVRLSERAAWLVQQIESERAPVEALVTPEVKKPPVTAPVVEPAPVEPLEPAVTEEAAPPVEEVSPGEVAVPAEPVVEEAPVEAKPEKPPVVEKPKPEAKPAPVKPLSAQTGEELIATIEADKKKPTGALKRTPAQYAELFKDADTDALKALRTWAKGDNIHVRQFLQPVIVAELQRRGEIQRKAEAEKRGKEIQAKKAVAEEKKPELRKARREQNKVMRALQEEVISQFEIESGESVETLQIIEEEAAEEAGANFTFSGKLPGEITDSFRDPKTGKVKIPAWFRQIVTWNTGIGGKAGGSEMVSRLGGAGFIKRARAIFDGKAGRIDASLDAAEIWARTGKAQTDNALLLKIERVRVLQTQLIGEAETPTETVNVSDLNRGDTFEILGDKVQIFQNAEGDKLFKRDGSPHFLFDGDTIPIDKGTLNKRKGVFKKATVEAAQKRIKDVIDGKVLFDITGIGGFASDLAIVTIDYFAEGTRTLAGMIKRILTDHGLWNSKDGKPTDKRGIRLAQAVRKAWAKTKDARTRIAVTEKVQKKEAKVIERKAAVEKRVKAVGELPLVEEVTQTTRQLLSLVLTRESRAAREAFREGAKEIVAKQKDLAAFASEQMKGLPLSEAQRAKLLRAVTKPRTPAEQRDALAAIQALIETGKRNKIIDNLKQIRQSFNKVKGQTDFELTKELESVFEIFRRTTDARAVANAIERVLAKRKAVGREVPADFPIWNVLARLKSAELNEGLIPMNRIPTDLLLDTIRSLQGLVHSEATHSQFLAAGKFKEEKATVEDAVEIIDKRHTKKKVGDMTRVGIFRLLKRALLRGPAFRSFLVELIGGQKGPVMEILHQNLRKGESDELAFHDKRLAFFMESLRGDGIDVAKLNLRKWGKDEVTVTIGGKSITTTQGFLAGLLGNLSDSNTRALLLNEEHKGLAFASNTTIRYKLSESDIPGLEKAANKTTTAVVKAVMGWYNGPQIQMLNEASQKLQGRDISKRPDRYPRHIDPKFLALEPNRLIREWLNRQAEYAGQFKPREGSLEPLIVDDIITAFEKDTKVAGTYVTKQAITQDATRLLSNPEFQEKVIDFVRDGKNLLSRLEQEVQAFHGLAATDFQAEDRLLRFFYHNFHVAVLGLRPHIGVYQFVSYFSSLTDIPFRYWVHKPYLPTKKRIAEMSAAHPELAARANSSAYSIMSSDDIGNTQKLGTDKTIIQAARDASLWHIRYMDMLAIVNIWEATKREAASKGFKGEGLTKEAARRTVEVIDATQPTWGVGNSSGWALKARKNPWFKALTLFSSQTTKYADRLAKAILRYSHGETSLKKMAMDVSIVTFLQSMMIYSIQRSMYWLYSGFQPDDDDDKTMWDEAAEVGFGVVRRILGLFLGVREVAVPIAATIESEVTGQDVPFFMEAPLLSMGKSGTAAMVGGAGAIRRMIEDQTFLEEQKNPAKIAKFIDDSQRFFSVIFGIPTQGPATIIRKATPKTFKQAFNSEFSRLKKKAKKAKEDGKRLAPLEILRLSQMREVFNLRTSLRKDIKIIEAGKLPKEVKRTRQQKLQDRIDTLYEKIMTNPKRK